MFQTTKYSIICAFFLFSLVACKPEQEVIIEEVPTSVELAITFTTSYDGERLIKNKDYGYDDFKIQFSHFSTFLSDIALLNGTEVTQLSEAEWLNFTPSMSTNDSAISITYKYIVPNQAYTGIQIGYGVRPDLNAKKPQDFPAGHALNNELEFWPGWKSYIFNRIEGQGDGNNDGIPDLFMLYHCGSDAVYRSQQFDQVIDVREKRSLAIDFDLKKLFWEGKNLFDIRAPDNSATSNLMNDVRVASILMNNFGTATSIK